MEDREAVREDHQPQIGGDEEVVAEEPPRQARPDGAGLAGAAESHRAESQVRGQRDQVRDQEGQAAQPERA